MSIWDRLLSLLRPKPDSTSRSFELDATLRTALVNLASQEGRPAGDLHADLLAAGLAQRDREQDLFRHWESLGTRAQDITALTCLGYTNRQIAARLGVSPNTVKGYVHEVLVRFNMHSKEELSTRLAHWDFSAWAPHPSP